jgi:UDP-3-O-[3-hydroxymyristoyl] glucosamine N-acyltransferase
LINKQVDTPNGKALLFSNNPFADYNKLTSHFRPLEFSTQPISQSAKIGQGSVIMPGVCVGNHVEIGKNCVIHPNTVIYDHAIIGDNVKIHAGSVIGADAFYYKTHETEQFRHIQLHACGRVIIEDHVDIGACCTIDRGVSGDTIIGAGSKLDNHIHIGHGTVVGKNCLFAAQVGIAGKVTIGDNVVLWGQVGIGKDLTIGDNAVVIAQSGVKDSLEGNKVYFGSPVREAREKMRELALIKKLPEIWEKLKN